MRHVGGLKLFTLLFSAWAIAADRVPPAGDFDDVFGSEDGKIQIVPGCGWQNAEPGVWDFAVASHGLDFNRMVEGFEDALTPVDQLVTYFRRCGAVLFSVQKPGKLGRADFIVPKSLWSWQAKKWFPLQFAIDTTNHNAEQRAEIARIRPLFEKQFGLPADVPFFLQFDESVENKVHVFLVIDSAKYSLSSFVTPFLQVRGVSQYLQLHRVFYGDVGVQPLPSLVHSETILEDAGQILFEKFRALSDRERSARFGFQIVKRSERDLNGNKIALRSLHFFDRGPNPWGERYANTVRDWQKSGALLYVSETVQLPGGRVDVPVMFNEFRPYCEALASDPALLKTDF